MWVYEKRSFTKKAELFRTAEKVAEKVAEKETFTEVVEDSSLPF